MCVGTQICPTALKLQQCTSLPQISESETSSGPELWSESDDEEGDDGAVDAGASPALKTVKVFAMFVLLWQSMFRVANVAVSMLFRFLSLFLNYISGPSQN